MSLPAAASFGEEAAIFRRCRRHALHCAIIFVGRRRRPLCAYIAATYAANTTAPSHKSSGYQVARNKCRYCRGVTVTQYGTAIVKFPAEGQSRDRKR